LYKDEFGHPDGKQGIELGIALPSWLVEKENAWMVLCAYTLIFGIMLPLWVANWWRGSKNFTKDRIMHETMGRFYRDLKESIKMRGMRLLLLIVKH
jgi:translocation protein SEC63